MSPFELGTASVIAIVFLIYLGVYIPVALGMVSFVSIWFMRDNFDLAVNLLKIALSDSVMEYTFATVPLFTFMGLIVSKAGMGRDIYEVMNAIFSKITGGYRYGNRWCQCNLCRRHRLIHRLRLCLLDSGSATDAEV